MFLSSTEEGSVNLWIKQRRHELDLTQEDLAECVGCSTITVQKIESGERRPSKQIAQRLAECLRIPADEQDTFVTLARTESPTPPRAPRRKQGAEVPGEQVSHDGGEEVAAPDTLPGRLTRPNNLTTQLTSFVGRAVELPRVRDLILTTEVRLLTLTGPPGTGKTRLALQAAAEVLKYVDFEDGVFFVNLAPIDDPGLVISEIAQTLNVREARSLPLLDAVKGYLKDRCLLLVLDNFEQVVEVAPVAGELLMAAPGVKVMVTSRVRLHIRGEKEFAVPPLQLPNTEELPPLDRLGQFEAIRLFVERATDIKDDFELTDDNATAVAHICARLDGLPMAIELAAARVKFLAPQTILSRLEHRFDLLTGGPRDLPARQRTLRSAIEWSYDLLDEDQQKLFRRLAVFVGGAMLEAIEAVCWGQTTDDGRRTTDAFEMEVLDGIQSLIDKSLLRQEQGVDGEPRFVMLETIHEYAEEKQEESGEAERLRREHGLYFMRMAEEAEPDLRGARQQEWLDTLEDEYDNLRAALQWARESGDDGAVEIGLRNGGSNLAVLGRAGLPERGPGAVEQVAERAAAKSVQANAGQEARWVAASRAKALNGAGILADLQGDYVSARSLHEEGMALKRELGDKRGVATSLNSLGSVAQMQGDYATARSLYEESLALKRELGDSWGIAISLSNIGLVAQQQGDYAAARSLYDESLALAREIGDKWGVAIALNNLGLVAHLQGEHDSAGSMYEESLALKRELGDKRGVAMSLSNLGLVALEQRDYDLARSRFEESLVLRRDLGDKWSVALSLAGLGDVAVAVGATGELGEIERGVRLLGAVEALLESTGAVLEAEDRLPYERAEATARSSLRADEFERLWAVGRAMSMEQAIEYALDA